MLIKTINFKSKRNYLNLNLKRNGALVNVGMWTMIGLRSWDFIDYILSSMLTSKLVSSVK